MTTRIPVSADPSGVVSAFEQIRQSIKRAGQEGREFSKLDLGHPELQELAEDVKRVHAQFETLKRLPGSAIRKRLQATGQGGAAPWDVDFQKMYPDTGKAKQAQGTIGQYITQGTQFGGRPAAPPTEEGKKTGFSMPGMPPLPGPLKIAGLVASLAGLGGVVSSVMEGAKIAREVAIGSDEFLRLMQSSTQDFDALRDQVKGVGKDFGILSTEAVKLTTSYAKAANTLETTEATLGAETAIAFGKGFGIRPESSVQEFARTELMGQMPPREFAMLLAESISKGGMFAKGEEVMRSIGQYVERASNAALQAPGIEAMAELRTSMYAVGREEGRPGLMGQAGDAILSAVENAVRRPGGDQATEFLMMRSMNRLGVTDPAQIEYLRGAGPFASAAGTLGVGADETVLSSIMDQLKQETANMPNRFWRYSAMQRIFQLQTPQHAEALEMSYDRLGKTGFGQMQAELERLKINPADIDESGFKELTEIFSPGANLAGIKEQYLKERDLTEEQKGLLETKNTEKLREELAKIAATQGRIETEGTKVLDAMTRWERALEDTGEKILMPLHNIKDSASLLVEGLNKILEYLGEEPVREAGPEKTESLNRYWDKGGALPEVEIAPIKPPPKFKGIPIPPKNPLEGINLNTDRLRGGNVLPLGPTAPTPEGQTKDISPVNPLEGIKLNTERMKGGSSSNYFTSPEWRRFLGQLENKHHLPEGTLSAIQSVESANNPNARSPDGAVGLFQFMPATAERFGVTDRTDPIQSAMAAAAYMQTHMREFKDLRLALAAYNAGEGAVRKYGGIPPYRETENYVPRVINEMNRQGNTNNSNILELVVTHRDKDGRQAGLSQSFKTNLSRPGSLGKVNVEAMN